MKTLYVRVAAKNVQSFGRAGHRFTRAWTRLTDIDEATQRVLEAEQLLEVSEKEPEGFESTAEGASPLQLVAPGALSPLRLTIVAAADGLLPTHVVDDLTAAVEAHFELDRRADRAEIARLQDEGRLHLVAEREALARVSAELADTKARLANALDDHAHLVQAYEALKRSVETPAAVAAAVSERVDSAIAQGDAALDKLKGAIDALAEGTAEVAPNGKAGKKGGK
jgi:uncharacterized protein YhaN